MKRILGIGNALVDIMTPIDNDKILEYLALPKGSMQLVDIKKSEQIQVNTKNFSQTRSSGGSVANTIHGLAMLGIDAGYIGSTGRDDTGDFFENDLKAAGVKTYLTRRNSVTGTALTLISPDSERTFATHLGAAVELHPADLGQVVGVLAVEQAIEQRLDCVLGGRLPGRAVALDRDRHAIFVIVKAAMAGIGAKLIEVGALDRLKGIGDAVQFGVLRGIFPDPARRMFAVGIPGFKAGTVTL